MRPMSLVFACCLMAGHAPGAGAGVVIEWSNPLGGDWGIAANWDPMQVPLGPGESVTIAIAGTYGITVPGTLNPVLDSFIMTNPNATLGIAGGADLSIAGPQFVNDGIIEVNPANSGDNARVVFAETVTMSGAGELRLVGIGDNSQLDSEPGASVTNGAMHSITGRGQINAALANIGVVDSDAVGEQLVLQTHDKSNGGVMRATEGTLVVSGITVTQGPGAEMFADGGIVRFAAGSSAVTGGTLRSANGGRVETIPNILVIATLTDVTVAGDFEVSPGGVIRIAGSGLSNNGLIRVNRGNSSIKSQVVFAADGALSGTGILELTGTDDNSQFNTAPGVECTIGPDQTITGRGRMDGTFINHGTIAPGLSAGALSVDGMLTQGSLSAMDIEIGGAATAAYDRIVATGTVHLAGALNVSLIDGFSPVLGDSFIIITATDGVTGTFGFLSAPRLGAGLGWALRVEPGQVASSSSSPAPATWTATAPWTRPI